jgi:iron-sulfur cluster assembly accessory protein
MTHEHDPEKWAPVLKDHAQKIERSNHDCCHHRQRAGRPPDRRNPQSEGDGAMLRISVEGGGCSGLSVQVRRRPCQAEDDLVIAREGAVVLVDSASVPFLAGSEVDFVDDLIGASFRVVNPNATASCGCGTFSI